MWVIGLVGCILPSVTTVQPPSATRVYVDGKEAEAETVAMREVRVVARERSFILVGLLRRELWS